MTSLLRHLLLLLVVLSGCLTAATAADTLRPAVAALQTAAASGEVPALQAAHDGFATAWPAVEDAVRAENRAAYLAIEEAMGDLAYRLDPDSRDPAAAVLAAQALVAASRPLLADQVHAASPVSPATVAVVAAPVAPTAAGVPTLASVLDQVTATRTQLVAGDPAAARATFAAVRRSWPDVEGAVKTRDAAAYRDCEDLLARCAAQLAAGDTKTDASLAALATRMAPFTAVSAYGASDAFLILLREGVEALLVIIALLAFLGRSGHGDKKRYVWLGAGIGVAVSVGLAFVVQLVFHAVLSGADREVIEGVVGLLAAGLLFWVSWWLHRAASLSRWNAQIADRTQAALASGSVASLSVLAFLTVLREGAETALFFLGMAPSISSGDLLLGLALGAGALAIIGVVFVRIGTRLPLRPFFVVLGILVLAMGVKFVGAGIHALQIAQWVPSSVIPSLPTIDLLGFYPTWETLLGQLAAIILALGLLTLGARPARRAATARPLKSDGMHV